MPATGKEGMLSSEGKNSPQPRAVEVVNKSFRTLIGNFTSEKDPDIFEEAGPGRVRVTYNEFTSAQPPGLPDFPTGSEGDIWIVPEKDSKAWYKRKRRWVSRPDPEVALMSLWTKGDPGRHPFLEKSYLWQSPGGGYRWILRNSIIRNNKDPRKHKGIRAGSPKHVRMPRRAGASVRTSPGPSTRGQNQHLAGPPVASGSQSGPPARKSASSVACPSATQVQDEEMDVKPVIPIDLTQGSDGELEPHTSATPAIERIEEDGDLLKFILNLRPRLTEPGRILEYFKREMAVTSRKLAEGLARVAREDWETYESVAFPQLKAEDRVSWMMLTTALKKVDLRN